MVCYRWIYKNSLPVWCRRSLSQLGTVYWSKYSLHVYRYIHSYLVLGNTLIPETIASKFLSTLHTVFLHSWHHAQMLTHTHTHTHTHAHTHTHTHTHTCMHTHILHTHTCSTHKHTTQHTTHTGEQILHNRTVVRTESITCSFPCFALLHYELCLTNKQSWLCHWQTRSLI